MPSDHLPRRRDELVGTLKADRLDALLVTREPNVTYLTGFTGDSSALLIGADRILLISDFRFETQLRDECPTLERHIRPSGRPMAKELGALLGTLGLGRVGFEAPGLSVADFEAIKAEAGSVELVGTIGKVEALRAVKDEDEIAAIRHAIAVAERAFGRIRDRLRAAGDEKEAADDLERELRRCGAAGSSFPPIVAAGPRSALPHARPAPGARLVDGGFVLLDWGANLAPLPYKSDLTRVVATGMVTSKFEEVYRVVLEAQRRAIAAIRPGAKACDVDAEARRVIADAGYGRFFDHGLGHGLGLEVHEGPRLRPGSDDEFRAGMVLTVEPGIYLPDWGGIRIEDDLLVTPDGAEVLSTLPRDLDSVRGD